MAPQTPRRIGRYQVLGRLATGGMAEVFLGRLIGPSGFERPVVIKRILPHLSDSESAIRMFLDEARIVAQIRHPNVVHVQELGKDDDGPYLVMEYLEGESLSSVLKHLRSLDERLDQRLVVHIISLVCAGLHAAHELTDPEGNPLSCVHRDVSPQNLFITYDGRVKVIDFGIARAAGRATRTRSGHTKGKFGYMAPEQIVSEHHDRRVDVFAVGVVLHEALTGLRLFQADNELAMVKAICQDEIPPPSAFASDVPSELDAICARALERAPEDRYATLAEMRSELKALAVSATGDAGDILAAEMSKWFAKSIADKRAMLHRSLSVPPPPLDQAEVPTLAATHSHKQPDDSSPMSRARWLGAGAAAIALVGAIAGVLWSGQPSRASDATPAAAPAPPSGEQADAASPPPPRSAAAPAASATVPPVVAAASASASVSSNPRDLPKPAAPASSAPPPKSRQRSAAEEFGF